MPNTREKLICDKCSHKIVCKYKGTCDECNQFAEDKWISVKDRLPAPHTYVICCGEIGGATLGYRMPNREWKGVTHWMPLPPAPEDLK